MAGKGNDCRKKTFFLQKSCLILILLPLMILTKNDDLLKTNPYEHHAYDINLQNDEEHAKNTTATDDIIRLKNKIKELEYHLTEILAQHNGGQSDVDDVKDEALLLEKAMRIFRKKLENYGDDSELMEITEKENEINKTLKVLMNELNARENREKQEKYIKDCIDSIRGRKFDDAENILILIGNKSVIHVIVGEIYKENTMKSYDILIEFAKKLKDLESSYLVCKAVYNELEIHDEIENGEKLLTLVQVIHTDVIKNVNDSNNIKIDALNMVNKIKKQIKPLVLEFLKNELNLNVTRKKIQGLPEQLFLYDQDFYDDIYRIFVIDTYKSTTNIINNLINVTKRRMFVDQHIFGCLCIFNEISANQDLNKIEIINLAHFLKEIDDNYGITYYLLPKNRKEQLEYVKKNLPGSVTNLVFAKQVCIKNIGKNEYLFAGRDDLLNDQERRKDKTSVFTWVSGNRVVHGVWKMVHKGENRYYIFNNVYQEYMFGVSLNESSGGRDVMTLFSSDVQDSTIIGFELYGNNTFMKFIKFNEYIYASNYIVGPISRRRRLVFLAKSAGKEMADSSWLWSIENCEQFDGV